MLASAGFFHDLGLARVEDVGVQRQGLVVRLHPRLIFLLREVGGPQVAVRDGGRRRVLERHFVGAFRLLIFVFAMVDGGQVIERFRIVWFHGQRHLVVLASLLKREHVMVGDTDLVPQHSRFLGIALIGLKRFCIAAMNQEQIAFSLGREGCGGWEGGHFRGRRR